MNEDEIEKLKKELSDLNALITNSEFINPKDYRRKEEIEKMIYPFLIGKYIKGRDYRKGLNTKGYRHKGGFV